MPSRPRLPDDTFDAVIYGTDLCSSLLAAALTTAGSTVLHIDSESDYGSHCATLPLSKLPPATTAACTPLTSTSSVLSNLVPLTAPCRMPTYRLLSAAAVPTGVYFDLLPRPILASGGVVDALVASGAGNYLSFRALEAMYVELPCSLSDTADEPSAKSSFVSSLHRVPASRADVFRSTHLSMREKRLLMRFLKMLSADATSITSDAASSALPVLTDDDLSPANFDSLAAKSGLPLHLSALVRHSVLFCEHDNALDLRQRATIFHQSVARYNTPTPFLYPNHGTAELCQAFCRVSAVHGGVYVLRCPLIGYRIEKQEDGDVFKLHTETGEVVSARKVFMPYACVENETSEKEELLHKQWRSVLVIDKSLVDQYGRIMITVPEQTFGNSATVVLRQLDSTTNMVPTGRFILYAETVGEGDENDLQVVLEHYVQMQSEEADAEENEKPQMLFGLTFSRLLVRAVDSADADTNGLVLIRAAEDEYDLQLVMAEARRCFKTIWPDKEMFEVEDEEEDEEEDEDGGNAEEENLSNGNVNDSSKTQDEKPGNADDT